MAIEDALAEALGVPPVLRSAIPRDLRPRLLDEASRQFADLAKRTFLHKATHIALGVEASQDLAWFAGEHIDDIRGQLVVFAPHPFESYTLTFWLGDEKRGMVETMLCVDFAEDQYMASQALSAGWDEDPADAFPHQLHFAPVDAVADIPGDTEEIKKVTHSMRSAWAFLNAFRLMLSQPGAITINQGSAPKRVGLHRGRRVNYYTQRAVTIDIDKARTARLVQHTGTGRFMPNYGYRAHLCHSGGLASCVHEWIEIGGRMDGDRWVPDAEHPRQNATWECYDCGRRRWHRRAGERGSLKVGEVRQTYRVKKGRGDIVPS